MYILREQEEAATKIQTRFRGNQSRKYVTQIKKHNSIADAENSAASKIQTRYRGNKARKRVKTMKEEHHAARTI